MFVKVQKLEVMDIDYTTNKFILSIEELINA